MDPLNSHRLLSERPIRNAAVLVLIAGIAISLVLWQRVSGLAEAEAQRRFERFSVHADAIIEERARVHLGLVSGFSGLIEGAGEFDRATFGRHFGKLGSGRWHPGLVAIQYLVRKEGGAREGSDWTIRHSEPPISALSEQLAADGTNASDALPLELAIEAGAAVATPLIRLEWDEPGFIVYQAVYRRNMPLDTVEERRRATMGFVRGIFRTSSMLDNALPQDLSERYRIWIEDLGGSTPTDVAAVVFDDSPSQAFERPEGGNLTERSYSLAVGGRAWMVHTLRPQIDLSLTAWPLTVLGAGVLVTLTLSALLYAIAAQYSRVTRLARQLSHHAESIATQLRSVIDHSVDGIVTIDPDGRLTSLNPATQRMFGLSPDQMIGRPLSDLLCPTSRADVAHLLEYRGNPNAGIGAEFEVMAHRADGAQFPLTMAFNHMGGSQPGLRVGMLRDVSERRRIESRMQHLALNDALTNLPNRALLQQRLFEAIERAVGRQRGAAREGAVAEARIGLMFIDLDRFKTINDSLGHHVGDRVLVEIARRLHSVMRSDDTVARMGGDEFVVVLPALSAPADAERVAIKALEVFKAPVSADGHELSITASSGLAIWPDMGEDAATLMSRADAAMYAAKQSGRNRWAWFDTDSAEKVPRRFRIETELQHAIARDQLSVHFQPQYDFKSMSLVGAEALLRWHHPELGQVSPAEFIAVAEESGLIESIGLWVLRKALGAVAQWQQAGSAPLHVAVNLSPRQMDAEGVVAGVAAALVDSGVPARLLHLEITESAVVNDVKGTAQRLQQLSDLGVSIAIDDFGTGYSSLSYLQDLPLNTLKIDRSFIQRLPEDGGTTKLVAALIAMAHQLEMEVVAEGVETEDQFAVLRRLGCETAQGYLLGRPMPADQFAKLLASVRKAGPPMASQSALLRLGAPETIDS